MAHIYLGNIHASEDDLQAFLTRYGFPRFDAIQHFPGNGLQPAVLLYYTDQSQHALRMLLPRINGMFWNSRRISALLPTERFM
ncbi:MAG: RNA-binding protein [Burkholderiaceae bacterium]|nr:RNA-binding protein [Burkholderiaceae bacterium]